MSGLDPNQLVFAQALVAGITSRLSSSEIKAVRNAGIFLAIWLSAFLVADGFVAEATVAGLKLQKLKDLLLFVPVVMGYFFYSSAAALSIAISCSEAF